MSNDKYTSADTPSLDPPTGATDTTPRERERTIEWFVAVRHDDYHLGVPHYALMSFLLTEREAGPEQAIAAITGAQADGRIEEREPNHYRPTTDPIPEK